MTKNFIVFIGVLLIGTFNTYSQVRESANVFGVKIINHSKVLDQDYELQINLPKSYDSSNKKYPVLYLLDGEKWHLYSVSLQKIFSEDGVTPEFIVVSLTTAWVEEGYDNQRTEFFGIDSKLFMNHLEKDVIAFVDKKYRTSSERLISGWQWAGSFMMETLIHKPALFNAYFIANLIPTNVPKGREKSEVKILRGMDSLLTKNKNIKSFLYLNTSTYETRFRTTDKLITLLKEKTPNSFKWVYDIVNYDSGFFFDHRDTSFEAISQGLRSYYFDYPPRFKFDQDKYDSYKKAGGVNYVKDYYKKRAERYGFKNSEVSIRTINRSVEMAMLTNNYAQFKLLMSTYKNEIFDALNLRSGLTKHGNFYLKHNQPNKAIEVFKFLSNKYSNKALVFNSLGKAYQANGDIEQAVSAFQQAIELAVKNSDEKLEQYKTDLQKTKTHIKKL